MSEAEHCRPGDFGASTDCEREALYGLSQANDKVLPEARLKSFVGHVGTRGHRTWRRCVSILPTRKDQKPTTVVRAKNF